MPGQPVTPLTVFIASPGDVQNERVRVREAIQRLEYTALKIGFHLTAVAWESHSRPGMGRPQERINPLVDECDLFIGILHKRFGKHTGEAESGTLEEFQLARERHTKEHAPEIMLYFRDVHPEFLEDPGEQLKKVIEFKNQIEDGNVALYFNYRDEEHFAALLQQHLGEWLWSVAKKETSRHARQPQEQPVLEKLPPLAVFAKHLEFCRTELQKTARPVRLLTLNLPPLFLEETHVTRPRSYKVRDAVKLHDRILILGEPGAGKTISLKKLAAEYANWHDEGKEGELQNLEGLNLPVFIDLASYPTLAADGNKHDLWRLIVGSVLDAKEDDVRKRLAVGGGLLLFDGLDETGVFYEDIVRQIRNLVHHEIPHNRFVVTCRESAYRNELSQGFMVYKLERLSRFKATEVLEAEIGTEKARAGWKALDEYTRDLCRNPLMLTLLADELRASEIPPTNRAELFHRFVNRYLEDWAGMKCSIDITVEKEMLSALAWRLGTGRSLLSVEAATAAMITRLKDLLGQSLLSDNMDLGTLNRNFLRHGLLQQRHGDTGFFHRAVQDYFLAYEVVRHQSPTYILGRVTDPEWAEILIFVCGMREDATPIVKEVMPHDANLAARCTAYARNVAGELVDELATVLIEKLKDRFEANLSTERLYQEMLAVLSIEPKTRSQNLWEAFRRAYGPDPKALYHFVRLLLETHGPHKAIPFVEPLVSEQPTEVRLRGLLAWALRRAERYEESLAQYDLCLATAPENALICGGKAKTYNAMKCWAEAEQHFSRALELDKSMYWARCHFGITLTAQKRFEEARKEFETAIMLNSEYALARMCLADLYDQHLNQPERAIPEYLRALQLEQRPKRLARIYTGLAQALQASGREQEARQYYQERRELFPWD